MKKVSFSLLFGLFVACSSLDIDVLNASDDPIVLSGDNLTRSSSTPISSHYVGVDQASKIVSSILDKRINSIETIRQDGIDLLHVANCGDGWALITADDRLPQQIIAYSDAGEFCPDSLSSPEVLFWYEMTKKQITQRLHYYDLESAEASAYRDDEYLRNYGLIWCRVPIGQSVIIDTLSSVDHLMETNWGQGNPWNVNCPIYNYYGDRMPTGCVAVAMAQILYYLHFYLGTPSGLYHQLTPHWSYHFIDNNTFDYAYLNPLDRNDYVSPSTRWGSMPLNKNGSNTQYVADLMLDIGDRVAMHYNPYRSGATPTVGAFNTYGISADSTGFNYASTKACLDNSIPVLIAATDPDNGGHAWVIDGYYDHQLVIDYTCEWRLSLYGSDDWLNANMRLSQNAMPSYDPDMFEGKIEIVRKTTHPQYLLMNWGWDDNANSIALNDGYYSILGDWSANGYHFTSDPYIIYNFDD